MDYDERPSSSRPKGGSTTQGSSNARVLVIDDDEMVLQTISTILRRGGYEVLAASNGEQGLELAREHSVALVMTDIVMPSRDGIEVILELRAEFPDLKVIAISGGGRIGKSDYLEMAERIGVCGTLGKPMTPDSILSMVEKHSRQ